VISACSRAEEKEKKIYARKKNISQPKKKGQKNAFSRGFLLSDFPEKILYNLSETILLLILTVTVTLSVLIIICWD